VSEFLHDIRFTWRSLSRRPVFAMTAILTLALAIGINTGLFTIINGVLLKPLAVSRPDRLVELYTSREDRVGGVSSYPDLRDLQSSITSMTGLAGHSFLFGNLSWQGRSELLIGEFATSNYLDVLGIHPQIGRFFTNEEAGSDGAALVTVIAHRFWQNRFGGDPAALDRTIELNGRRYTIIGVMPPDFEGTFPGLSPEVWIPVGMVDSLDPFGQIDVVPSPGNSKLTRRGYRWLWAIGRLKDSVTLPQAESEIEAINSRLVSDYPQSNGKTQITLKPKSDVHVNPELDGILTSASAFLLVVAGIVLLVACTNVAGVFLARTSSRRREIAVRLALGTGRWRLIQQLLIESTSIALVGGALGLALAVAGGRLLTAVQLPIPITIRWNLSLDWRVYLFTFGVSLLAGISFGLAPAIQSIRRDLITDLKGGDPGRARNPYFRNGLVVAQLALSLVLLVGASLLIRSADAATHIDLGFAAEHYGLVQLNLEMYGYTGGRAETFYRDLEQRMRGIPGVEAVTMATRTPLSININATALYPTATPSPDTRTVTVDDADVDPGFFATLQVPIIEGRAIDERDTPDSPIVAVVSQAMAKQLWPGESAVGKQVQSLSGHMIQIVGVSRDYKVRTVGESPRAMIHFARQQSPNPSSGIIIRTSGRASAVLPLLRDQVSALDVNVVPFQLTTLEEEMSRSLFAVTMGAKILGGLGAFTVLLAGVGLYGLIAYSVSRRTREIGTRIALGATRARILRQILLEGGRLLAVGTVIGGLSAAIMSRLLQTLLYGISSLDWLSFGLGITVLMLVALLANMIPAVGASRVEPTRALRQD
jgi:putative ABC transport system permease protein